MTEMMEEVFTLSDLASDFYKLEGVRIYVQNNPKTGKLHDYRIYFEKRYTDIYKTPICDSLKDRNDTVFKQLQRERISDYCRQYICRKSKLQGLVIQLSE